MASIQRDSIAHLKDIATNRWVDILGIETHLLDGHHHPCPKCGGKDRFRALDDFNQTGAVICNQCFTQRNGDGLSAYQWYHDCSFSEAFNAIAKQLGLAKPTDGKSAKNGETNQTGTAAKKKDCPRKKLKELFTFLPWNDQLISIYCLRKKGIRPEAFEAVGAKMAKHAGQPVVALPIRRAGGEVFDQDKELNTGIVGFSAGNVTGGLITIKRGDSEETTTWKNQLGQEKAKGVIATNNFFTANHLIKRVFKTEGPGDLLALTPFLAEDEAAFCNPNGAKENPGPYLFLAELIEGKQVITIHDCDTAGQEGALKPEDQLSKGKLGWANWAAVHASESRNLVLPFEITPSKGKDLRDWVQAGGTRTQLINLVESSKVVKAPDITIEIHEDASDPHRIARANLDHYRTNHKRQLVFWRDVFYRWKSGRYVPIDRSDLRAKITQFAREYFEDIHRQEVEEYHQWVQSAKYDSALDKGPPKIRKVKRTLVSDVIGAMEGMCVLPGSLEMPSWIPDRSRRHYLAMGNGILDLEQVCNGKPMEEFLLPHSPNWFSSVQVPYDFTQTAGCPKWLDYIDYVMDGDQERINILQEFAGYLLMPDNPHQKFLVLEGEGGNGKTVFFAGIRAMLGDGNVSSVSIENFGDRFSMALTLGKAVNISADMDELNKVAEGVIKQFTGGDTMVFDRKNKDAIAERPTAKLLAAWNKRPRFKDRSQGLWRRMIIIPFLRSIPHERRILGMDDPKWWIDAGEASGILRWAIIGLDRLRDQGGFSKSVLADQVQEDLKTELNPAREFLQDFIEVPNAGEYRAIDCTKLYRFYRKWCESKGVHPLADKQFGKEVTRAFPGALRTRTRVDGVRKYVYEKLQYASDEIAGESTREID